MGHQNVPLKSDYENSAATTALHQNCQLSCFYHAGRAIRHSGRLVFLKGITLAANPASVFRNKALFEYLPSTAPIHVYPRRPSNRKGGLTYPPWIATTNATAHIMCMHAHQTANVCTRNANTCAETTSFALPRGTHHWRAADD